MAAAKIWLAGRVAVGFLQKEAPGAQTVMSLHWSSTKK
jgi:hypothetical protein